MRSPAASGIRGYAEHTFIRARATACWCVCGGIQTGAAVSDFAPVEEQTKASPRDIQRQFSLSPDSEGTWIPAMMLPEGFFFPLPARLSERCEYNSPDP